MWSKKLSIWLFALFCLLGMSSAFAQEYKLVLPIGHVSPIANITYSKDGKYIYTHAEDGLVKTWDNYAGELLETKKDSNDPAIKYTKKTSRVNGKMVVKTILYNQTTKKQIGFLNADFQAKSIIAYNKDSTKVIISFFRIGAELWDLKSGKMIFALKNFKNLTFAYFYDHDRKIFTLSQDTKGTKILSATTGKSIIEFRGNYLRGIPNPDGTRIMVLSVVQDSWNLKGLYDLETDRMLYDEYNENFSSVDSSDVDASYTVDQVAFVPHMTLVAANCSDSAIRVFNEQNKVVFKLKDSGSVFTNFTFHPDGKSFTTAINNDGSAKVWAFPSGKSLLELKGHTAMLALADRYGANWITAYWNGKIKIFDPQIGRVTSLTTLPPLVNDLLFSADAKTIAVGDGIYEYYLKDLTTNKIFPTLNTDYTGFKVKEISANHQFLLLYNTHYEVTSLWDAEKGKTIKKYGFWNEKENIFNAVSEMRFHPNGKTVTAFCNDYKNGKDSYTIRTWDLTTGKIIYVRKPSLIKRISITHLCFNADGSKLAYMLENLDTGVGTLQIWDFYKNTLLASRIVPDVAVSKLEFSPDGKQVFVATSDSRIQIYDQFLKQINVQFAVTGTIKKVDFEQQKLAAINESELIIYDLKTKREAYRNIAIDSADYLNLLPSGYYMATQNATKLLHYVTKDLKVITFEQLDIKYNRPDKVLQAMGSLDTALINSYKQAYDKRIKKLKIDTTAFKSGYVVPSADFKNRNQISFTQQNGRLSLQVYAKDETYSLNRFNLWVNGVPLFGMLGIDLKNSGKNTLDTTLTIALSTGDNRIETSVTNSNGIESYRMPLFVNYHPVEPKRPKIYFIGIGINKFEQKEYNLNYSVKDIRDLTTSLKKKYGTDFIVVDTLFDERVSPENVTQLKAQLQNSGVDDKVIIAYSGHGLLSKTYDYFLSTYAIDFENPATNGLPYEELEALLDGIPSRQKLLLIDACHSGEVDKDEVEMVAATEAERTKESVKGIKLKVKNKGNKVGMKNSFELMKELFVNVNKSTGATVISAAGGTQYALEKGDLKNGVFTYAILELLRDRPSINVSELKNIVSKRVETLTAGAQKPTSRSENSVVNWKVW